MALVQSGPDPSAFNRVLKSLLTTCKADVAKIPQARRTYRSLHMASAEHRLAACGGVDMVATMHAVEKGDPSWEKAVILPPGISVERLTGVDDAVTPREVVVGHMQALLAMAYAYESSPGDIDSLAAVLAGQARADNPCASEDLTRFLDAVTPLPVTFPLAPPPAAAANVEDLARCVESSKLGKLAKDLAADVDLSAFDLSDPMAMMTSGGGALGDLLQTVGAKLSEKSAAGELNTADLIRDATSMFSSMGGAEGIQGMLGALLAGGLPAL